MLPSAEDLDFLSDLFPYDGDFATNVELGIGLARNGHADVLPVLQAAVWSGSLHRSVLAAAVIIGSIVNSLPPSCTMVSMNGVTYQQCGSTWYQPQFVGTTTSYIIVAAPR